MHTLVNVRFDLRYMTTDDNKSIFWIHPHKYLTKIYATLVSTSEWGSFSKTVRKRS